MVFTASDCLVNFEEQKNLSAILDLVGTCNWCNLDLSGSEDCVHENMKNFNRNHPERLPSEVFIINATHESTDIHYLDCSPWVSIGWRTKRQGKVAYDDEGAIISEGWPIFPVFAKQWEVEQAGHGILERLLP